MGFPKYARANVVDPAITQEGWGTIRQAAINLGPSFEARQSSIAQSIVLQEYDPSRYLLSHCSIIASVDTESPGMPTGVQMFDGVQIDRRYPDFYVTEATAKYINNNNDCWERKLLLAAYKTFIGGENYVEHIQIPELSKGKIIDAAARDIGDSIYVDILVATDKKHASLINAIASGELSTLSMGCHVSHTICTKCGNAAEDELQLCKHIKYQKGQWFVDAAGKRRKIAELCGHITVEPGSVKFIEGSWVASPAFTGAVLRNILDPATAEMADQMRRRIQVAFSEPARVVDPTLLQKAASLQRATNPNRHEGVAPHSFVVGAGVRATSADHLPYLVEGEPIGELRAPKANSTPSKAEANLRSRREQLAENHRLNQQRIAESLRQSQQDFPGQGQGEQAKPKEEETDPLKKVVNDLYETLRTQVVDRVREDLNRDEATKVRNVIDENSSNESIIKSALRFAKWQTRANEVLAAVKDPKVASPILAGLILHDFGGWDAVARAKRFSGREILVMARLNERLTKKASMAGDARIYRTVMTVGGTKRYANEEAYLAACRQVVGRDLMPGERSQLVEKGNLFSLGL